MASNRCVEPPGFGPRATRRRVLLVAVLVLLAALAVDASRSPEHQRSAAAAIRLVHAYQRTISASVGRIGIRCRFTPTCSRYAEAVLRKHGIIGGTWRAAWRVARCGPWTRVGTVDPPD